MTPLRSGRNPFEVALMIVCVAVGVVGLIVPGPGPSPTLAAVFGWASGLIYAGFLIAPSIALIGLAWPRDTVRRLQVGMSVERAALYPVSGMAAAYAGSAFASSGLRAVVAASLIGAIALACLLRARQITADLRSVAEVLPDRE